jgi:hypothetical protein
VLSRPEFRREQTWAAYLWEKFLQWARWLAALSDSNPVLFKALIVSLVAILIALVAHIIYTMVREFTSLRRPPDSARAARPARALDGIAENWTDALRLARAALDSGDLYRAVWITHRILLSALDRRDRLKFARWKTNTDYLRECRGEDSASKTLGEITAAYERIVYAHGDFDRAQAARLMADVEAIASEAAR